MPYNQDASLLKGLDATKQQAYLQACGNSLTAYVPVDGKYGNLMIPVIPRRGLHLP